MCRTATDCTPLAELAYIRANPDKARETFSFCGRTPAAAKNREKGPDAARTANLGNKNALGGAHRPPFTTPGARKLLVPLGGLTRSIIKLYKDVQWECTKCGHVPGGSERFLRAVKCPRSSRFPRGLYSVNKPHGHYEPPDMQCAGTVRPIRSTVPDSGFPPDFQNKTHCKWFREGRVYIH